jgi:short-subunit dehydrogenase
MIKVMRGFKPNTLHKKTVVITGASEGVGASCARLFAASGAYLVLAARGKEKLDKIVSEVSQLSVAVGYAMDVCDLSACDELLAVAKKRFGHIHVLINNAGFHDRGPFDTIDPRNIAYMVDVNIRAPIYLTSAAMPYLTESEGGAVVMVGSLAGMGPLSGASVYSGTKSGLRTFTFALREELINTNIRCAIVSPGPIDTGFIMKNLDSVDDIVFSQAMSTADGVAAKVKDLVEGEKAEIAIPRLGGILALFGASFPVLRRLLRPLFSALGRKNKRRYLKRHRSFESGE